MKYISITVPKTNKDKWMFSITGRNNGKTRANVHTLFNQIEKYLHPLSSTLKEKHAVRVNYDDGINVSLSSTDPKYLIYVMSCFLEDHLSEIVLRRTEKFASEF
jgi:hypothetical protein